MYKNFWKLKKIFTILQATLQKLEYIKKIHCWNIFVPFYISGSLILNSYIKIRRHYFMHSFGTLLTEVGSPPGFEFWLCLLLTSRPKPSHLAAQLWHASKGNNICPAFLVFVLWKLNKFKIMKNTLTILKGYRSLKN